MLQADDLLVVIDPQKAFASPDGSLACKFGGWATSATTARRPRTLPGPTGDGLVNIIDSALMRRQLAGAPVTLDKVIPPDP